MPQKAAGSLTLPAQSLPSPNGEPQATIRAASPPLLPPGVRPVLYGLLVLPKMWLSVSKAKRRSGRLVFTIGIPPAARRRFTNVASSVAGVAFFLPSVPAVQE